ncbi:flavin-containing monooxygenase [Nocardia terpenica]|uniref:Monooxygenase n=1 Tax=Nocardia terpenica TaxID=455432 RepID=A0A164JIG6_9NOCA|nr:NAD(P)/FAD-dependent oxidoreductase [Nocardia terpenica]KZM70434.1 monooxygenase [Nocardia terpenica]NQE91116.1 NAD(P)/FAD-dependent oxidoreductase [Nocardia terpenica]
MSLAISDSARTADADVPASVSVVIIGAGIGGLGMAVALQRAGFSDYLIVEEADDLGGVWRDNTYPGCACDVPSHLYSFSFAPYQDRHCRYPGQAQILSYLRQVAVDHHLYPHLRTSTPITTVTWHADSACWELTTRAGERIRAEVVVFAVGQLHRPHIPDIPGRDRFEGAAFHSAAWDHGQGLRGRAIAVIGTGSSAAQLVPRVATQAGRVAVFQRTPHWVLPKPAADFGPITRRALRLPGAHRLYRQALSRGADLVLSPIMRRGWSARPAELVAKAYLRHSIPDPALRAALTPDYPIGAKRIVFDSHWFAALRRESVELVTAPITQITATGIQTVDGAHREVDVIVYATGFRAPQFLHPMTVRGRGGRILQQQWASGAQAYLGLAVPGYPNLFLIAGPNAFNSAGSNPGMKEAQIAFIVKCLRWRAEIGASAIEVSGHAMRRYQRWLDTALTGTVWPASVPNWYTHPSGRVTNPWPADARTFTRMLDHHPASAFDPTFAPTPAPPTPRPLRPTSRTSQPRAETDGRRHPDRTGATRAPGRGRLRPRRTRTDSGHSRQRDRSRRDRQQRRGATPW